MLNITRFARKCASVYILPKTFSIVYKYINKTVSINKKAIGVVTTTDSAITICGIEMLTSNTYDDDVFVPEKNISSFPDHSSNMCPSMTK